MIIIDLFEHMNILMIDEYTVSDIDLSVIRAGVKNYVFLNRPCGQTLMK